jgi:fluoroacetyl-CoA thioesterase
MVQIGNTRQYRKIVSKEDIAQFSDGVVHEVYSTFAIARDAEWCGRLFVLDMKDAEQEGIGTFVNIKHVSAAFVGDEVVFTGTYTQLTEKGEIIVSIEAKVADRIICTGSTGQRILPKQKIDAIFSSLKKNA